MKPLLRRCLIACVLVGPAWSPGCVAEPQTAWERHLDPGVWSGAFAVQLERPVQWAPAAALLVATPVLAFQDNAIQEHATEHAEVTGGDARSGDAVLAGMTALTFGVGATEWIGGDDGHSAEVFLESFLVVAGLTQGLKVAVERHRPDAGNPVSFPSGHSAYAFSLATYLARAAADSTDAWYGNLGYLAYVPATYVGINRVESNRHYASDVAFGAFLGVALTNLVFDAHRGSEGRRGIHAPNAGPRIEVEPTVMSDGAGVELVIHF